MDLPSTAFTEHGPIRSTRKGSIVSIERGVYHRMSVVEPSMAAITEGAVRATAKEHEMTLWQGIKAYPHAVFWSMVLSTAIIMEGFDIILLTNLFAFAPFQKQFGQPTSTATPDGSPQLTAAWQSGLSNGALVGEIIGLFLNGLIADRYGYRFTMMAALLLVTAFVFIVFFAETVVQLLIGEILLGIPWGAFQTLTTTYAAEVCPLPLRAYLTTYVNLCWVIGQLLASGVLRIMVSTRDDQWGYRIPFALQWFWPPLIILGVAFAPESPWWLVRRERLDEAKQSIVRLTSVKHKMDVDLDETIAMMHHTDVLEKTAFAGTRYTDCFKGTNLRRTEIVCFTWAIQTLCGASLMSYSTYFYQQAGLDSTNAFTLTMAQFALGIVGTIFSWYLMRLAGRRTLYLIGQLGMTCLLFIIGCLGLISKENTAAQWAIGSMLLLYTFTYDATVGPVCYALVAELSSNRLRGKTVVLARNLFNICGIATNTLTAHMLNPTSWDWGAKTGFFWAGSCFLCLVWTWYRLPEAKGRTFAELDILFEQKVAAREFRDMDVNPFTPGGGSIGVQQGRSSSKS